MKKQRKIKLKVSRSKSWKGILNKRQGEIFRWVKKETYRKVEFSKIDFVGKELTKREIDNYVDSHYSDWKLNKVQRNQILKEANRLYRTENEVRRGQIEWYQKQAGFSKVHGDKIVKTQKPKGIFFKKGEHAEGKRKQAEFRKLWEKVKERKGRIRNLEEVERISKELYYSSPRRLRDRFLVKTEREKQVNYPLRSEVDILMGRKKVYDHTKPYYNKAISKYQANVRGKKLTPQELKPFLDKKGRLRQDIKVNDLEKKGYSLIFDLNKPGAIAEIKKKVPSQELRVKQEVKDRVHSLYIKGEGSDLEKKVFSLKSDKSLCWVESVLGEDCQSNYGGSGWWCFFCVNDGANHPPVLPKDCPWLYTYRPDQCGGQKHSAANKQWHFSVMGEQTREKIPGGDWGSCHIGTFASDKSNRLKRK